MCSSARGRSRSIARERRLNMAAPSTGGRAERYRQQHQAGGVIGHARGRTHDNEHVAPIMIVARAESAGQRNHHADLCDRAATRSTVPQGGRARSRSSPVTGVHSDNQLHAKTVADEPLPHHVPRSARNGAPLDTGYCRSPRGITIREPPPLPPPPLIRSYA